MVTAASVSNTAAGVPLLSRIATPRPHVRKAWVDASYRTTTLNHGSRLASTSTPSNAHPHRGCTIILRRWTIERSIGWPMHYFRLARNYETRPHRSEAVMHLAMIDLMARRLTGETTPSGRGT